MHPEPEFQDGIASETLGTRKQADCNGAELLPRSTSPFIDGPLPIEDIILASALTPVLKRNRKLRLPEEATDLDCVEKAFQESLPRAADVIAKQSEITSQFEKLSELMKVRN